MKIIILAITILAINATATNTVQEQATADGADFGCQVTFTIGTNDQVAYNSSELYLEFGVQDKVDSYDDWEQTSCYLKSIGSGPNVEWAATTEATCYRKGETIDSSKYKWTCTAPDTPTPSTAGSVCTITFDKGKEFGFAESTITMNHYSYASLPDAEAEYVEFLKQVGELNDTKTEATLYDQTVTFGSNKCSLAEYIGAFTGTLAIVMTLF